MIDQKKLALIHIVKKELQLSDEEYRAMLLKFAGVHSAKDLDGRSFRKLMNHFVRGPHYKANHQGMTLKQKMFIDSLARQLHWEKEHLSNFIHKYYHSKDPSLLTRREAGKLIEGLKHIREKYKIGNAGKKVHYESQRDYDGSPCVLHTQHDFKRCRQDDAGA